MPMKTWKNTKCSYMTANQKNKDMENNRSGCSIEKT